MKSISLLIATILLSCSSIAQEDPALAKATTKKIIGKWQQTESSTLSGDKAPGSDVLILFKDLSYSWLKTGDNKARSGKWKVDNYGKTSNTGKMMELLVLDKNADKGKIYINRLTDSTLVLRIYPRKKGAMAKDDFIDMHFNREK